MKAFRDSRRKNTYYCLFCIHKSQAVIHVKLYSVSEGVQNINMPGDDEMFKFSAMHATIKPTMRAYFDCESISEQS